MLTTRLKKLFVLGIRFNFEIKLNLNKCTKCFKIINVENYLVSSCTLGIKILDTLPLAPG